MGNTRRARMTVDGQTYDGEALLETEELIFRGEQRIVVRFRDVHSLAVEGPTLRVNDSIAFDLGPDAAKWAEKIRNPKSVVQKLGVKPGQKVAVIGVDDAAFAADLEAAGAEVSLGRAKRNCDAIFYGASSRAELSRLTALKTSLAANGALWVIRPKGVKTITESEVMAAGKAAGLVDVKVVKFSETHTAEKFVIPLAARPKQM